METRNMEAPFGSRVGRFLGMGAHPGFERQGCLKSIPTLGPGTYNPQFKKRHIRTPNWTHELKAEEFARTFVSQVL